MQAEISLAVDIHDMDRIKDKVITKYISIAFQKNRPSQLYP
jgi:hypothetical protein